MSDDALLRDAGYTTSDFPYAQQIGMTQFQVLCAIGAIAHAVLYVVALLVLAVMLSQPWIAVAGATVTGVTYLSYVVQINRASPAWLCSVMHSLSIGVGIAAGAFTLVVML